MALEIPIQNSTSCCDRTYRAIVQIKMTPTTNLPPWMPTRSTGSTMCITGTWWTSWDFCSQTKLSWKIIQLLLWWWTTAGIHICFTGTLEHQWWSWPILGSLQAKMGRLGRIAGWWTRRRYDFVNLTKSNSLLIINWLLVCVLVDAFAVAFSSTSILLEFSWIWACVRPKSSVSSGPTGGRPDFSHFWLSLPRTKPFSNKLWLQIENESQLKINVLLKQETCLIKK